MTGSPRQVRQHSLQVLLVVLLAIVALGAVHVLLIDTFRREAPDNFRALIIAVEVAFVVLLAAVAATHLLSVARERSRHAVIESLAEAFSVPRSIEEIAQISVAQLVGSDVAASALLAVAKEDGQQLDPVAASGYPPHSGIMARDAGGLLPAETTVRRGAELTDPWLAPLAARSGQRPWVAHVPIVSDEEVLGLLLLVSPPHSLLGDARLLRTVSTLIAAALDHAQLYEAAYAPPASAEDVARGRQALLRAVASELGPALVSVEAHASVIAGEDTSPGTIEDARRLSELSQSIERLKEMLEDLTGIGPAAEDGETHEPAPTASTDVARVTRSAVAALGPAFEARLQAVEVELPDQPLTAAVSVDAVERLLLHLLTNANRSAPDEGRVTVRAYDDGDTVRIEVEDSGPALDLLEREHIFEPFYRVSAGLPEVPGAGLGLAVVRQLAESQGGAVWAEPRPGGGTAYYVELPTVARVPAADDAPPLASAEPEEIGEEADVGADLDAPEDLLDEPDAGTDLAEDAAAQEADATADDVIEMDAPEEEVPIEEREEELVPDGEAIDERLPDIEAIEDELTADEEAAAVPVDETRFEPGFVPDDEPTQPLDVRALAEAAGEDRAAAEAPESEFDAEPYEYGGIESNGLEAGRLEEDALEVHDELQAASTKGDGEYAAPDEVAVGDDVEGDDASREHGRS